jgi:hypothetical protein
MMSGDTTAYRALGLRLEHRLSSWLQVGAIGINLWAQISEVSEYRVRCTDFAVIELWWWHRSYMGGGYKNKLCSFQYEVVVCWLSVFFKDKIFVGNK